MGTSKVQIEMAKTKDVLIREKRHKHDPEKAQAPANPSKVLGRFEEYKNILDKGSKQSWNDLIVGEEMQAPVKEKPQKTQKSALR